MNNGMDLDPLSSYEYPAYDSYHPLPNTQAPSLPPYPYQEVKQEYYNQSIQNTNYTNIPQTVPQEQLIPQINKLEINNEDKNKKTEVKKRRDKKNGKNLCSQKITDTSYPFYGCSICNISYTALHELDQHVTIHKNRLTSYRLRLRNQYKKKQIKKERKKMKKMKKIKQENDTEFEIKPEDGYIGSEKATDYVNNEERSLDKELNENKEFNENKELNGNKEVGSSVENNKESIENKEKEADDDELNNVEKIYKCFACQKQFTLSYYLKLHVRSHTDEKPYTCNVCGHSFITASKLGRHNKRIHLAARFQCRICFKIFSRFELLTNHFDKNHPEDKLEGEPYDYNAILPYLKELEDQLKEQNEANVQKKEEPWLDVDVQTDKQTVECGDNGDVKKEEVDQDEEKLLPKIDIIVEELKVDSFDDVKVKQEEDNDMDGRPEDNDPPDDDHRNDDDDVKNEDFKDDSLSDEDYFPSNTWAATPKCDPSPPPSPKRRKKCSFKSKTCEICAKVISSASYMRVHMRTHTGEKPFKCYTCGRGFITSSKLNRHVLTHGTDAKQEDEIKQEDTDVKQEDLPSEDNDDNEGKKKKKKKSKSKLSRCAVKEEKVKKKNQKRPHSCEYCNQKFLHLKMLEVHKKCHEGEALILKCQYCLEEALDSEALREHEATHAGPKPYLCTICGKSYKKRETMVYHRKQHQPEKEFVCDVCSKRFSAACKLAKHLATHRAGFVLRYECPVCAHMFNTQYHVQMHLATHQKEGLILESNRNEVLAMVLQNALKIPKQPDAASNLTDITPSDERYRICKICGETFHHFYYLEEHLKSHGSKIAIDDTNKQDDKKYICQICHKGFKLHYYLKLHSFTHSKEKPFICQQCGKGFITKGKLKRHLETHSGLKKYQCHICYKFFTRPSYLRIHIRTIHGTQDYNYRFDKSLTLSAITALAQRSDRQNVATN